MPPLILQKGSASMPIKNIVFDMGNVLISFDRLFYCTRQSSSEEDRGLLLDEVFRGVEWTQTDRGSVTPEDAAASICKRLPERLHKSAKNIVTAWYKDGGLRIIPGMEELISSLKNNGYKTYLLSNASVLFYEYYKQIPAITMLDGIFLSADWRLLKPSEDIYRAFFARFSLTPAECFFIDDLPINIEGALNTGMNGFIFKGNIEKLKNALLESGVKI